MPNDVCGAFCAVIVSRNSDSADKRPSVRSSLILFVMSKAWSSNWMVGSMMNGAGKIGSAINGCDPPAIAYCVFGTMMSFEIVRACWRQFSML